MTIHKLKHLSEHSVIMKRKHTFTTYQHKMIGSMHPLTVVTHAIANLCLGHCSAFVAQSIMGMMNWYWQISTTTTPMCKPTCTINGRIYWIPKLSIAFRPIYEPKNNHSLTNLGCSSHILETFLSKQQKIITQVNTHLEKQEIENGGQSLNQEKRVREGEKVGLGLGGRGEKSYKINYKI